jgi:hypothetical protein
MRDRTLCFCRDFVRHSSLESDVLRLALRTIAARLLLLTRLEGSSACLAEALVAGLLGLIALHITLGADLPALASDLHASVNLGLVTAAL